MAEFFSFSNPVDFAKKIIKCSKDESIEMLKKFYLPQDDRLSFLFASNPKLKPSPVKPPKGSNA
jgi:hypothetical protein